MHTERDSRSSNSGYRHHAALHPSSAPEENENLEASRLETDLTVIFVYRKADILDRVTPVLEAILSSKGYNVRIESADNDSLPALISGVSRQIQFDEVHARQDVVFLDNPCKFILQAISDLPAALEHAIENPSLDSLNLRALRLLRNRLHTRLSGDLEDTRNKIERVTDEVRDFGEIITELFIHALKPDRQPLYLDRHGNKLEAWPPSKILIFPDHLVHHPPLSRYMTSLLDRYQNQHKALQQLAVDLVEACSSRGEIAIHHAQLGLLHEFLAKDPEMAGVDPMLKKPGSWLKDQLAATGYPRDDIIILRDQQGKTALEQVDSIRAELGREGSLLAVVDRHTMITVENQPTQVANKLEEYGIPAVRVSSFDLVDDLVSLGLITAEESNFSLEQSEIADLNPLDRRNALADVIVEIVEEERRPAA
jgi:hypothetical protein